MNYNLTSSQKNIWNLQKYYEDTTISTICGAILYEKRIETSIIQSALNTFLKEQDAFRLRFRSKDGDIKQFITDYEKEEFLVREFVSKEDYLEYVEQEKMVPFQLDDGKMYRFTICLIADKTAILAVLNHMVSDAWTLGILAERVSEIIALSENEEEISEKSSEMSDRQASYISHIEKEEAYYQTARYKKDKEFWQNEYSLKPDIAYIKPERGGNTGVGASRYINETDKKMSEDISSFCNEHRYSRAVLFEAALIIYLGRINPDNRNVTIGIPVLNRTGNAEKRTAGMFISTMPLSVQLNHSSTVKDLINSITGKHSETFRHQRYPYSSIQEYIREKHQMQGNVYDVMVSYQNAEVKSELTFHTEWYGNGYSEVALAFHIDDRDINGAYRITMDYQTDVFRDEKEVSHS